MTESSNSEQTPPVRVCHVSATVRAIWMQEQLATLRDVYGWDASCLTGGPEGSIHPRLREKGIPYRVFDFDLQMLPDPWRLTREIVALARAFRRERYDVVQTCIWHSMLAGRLAAWLADVPVRLSLVVGQVHLDAPISRWIDATTCWMDSRIIATCEYIRRGYSSFGVSANRLALVYLGIDETRFDPDSVSPYDLRTEYGWPADTPVIGHVAWFYMRMGASRWIPEVCHGRAAKGHDDLIRATPHILREFPNARVVLIGGGWHDGGMQYIQEMKALVEELGLQEHVIFADARSNVANIYQAIDIAVQPSLTESCGGTLESLLMAKPTVATRVGGMPDMVIDGQTGVLVNPSDPEDLARGICELLRDRDRARALGQVGRAHVLRTATLHKTTADLDALYRTTLFENGRRRTGYRWWVPVVRLPVVVAIAVYLHCRYVVIECTYLPRWRDGWRPWQLRALARMPFDLPRVLFRVVAPRSWVLKTREAWARLRQRVSRQTT